MHSLLSLPFSAVTGGHKHTLSPAIETTMSIQSPSKLLEINIISAHDLPPVSKMLRTFAVAYVHPDHKLTTKIDHQGHTNPTWNYKVLLPVDEKFFKQESSAVTIEIYNLAWLRDLPIGTTRLLVNNLSPSLIKNPAFRRVALKISRPSGHLQGTLNLGVRLLDNTIPGEKICTFPLRNDEQIREEEEEKEEARNLNQEEDNYFQVEQRSPGPALIKSRPESISATQENMYMNMPNPIKSRPESSPGQANMKSRPESSPGPVIVKSRPESISATPESRYMNNPGSEHETNASLFSVMKPLPSEVADDLKKGVYTKEWSEYGSSIFENWTECGDSKSEVEGMKVQAGSEHWEQDQVLMIPLTTGKNSDYHSTKKSKKKGLFSCFGNAYGIEFSIICGSGGLKKKKEMMKNRMNRNVNKQNVHLMTLPNEDLREFYV